MKTALIIADGIQQIMLTPESEEERNALQLITPDKDITIERKEGTLFDSNPPNSAKGYTIQKCNGDYLRAYECEKSLMLVLKPKKTVKKDEPNS